MAFDELTVRADEATRRADEAYRQLERRYDDFLERERHKRVSRRRFSTLVDRIRTNGAPYGAHTIVYRPSGELLLVRHEGVDLWVLPGGGVDPDESFAQAARRELEEEAGVDVDYDGLAMISTVEIETQGYRTRGVLPIFAARAESVEPDISDPDDEISVARWFSRLPDDTRDRDDLVAWRRQRL
ncbi:NUDIX hydrolase [Natronoglomus mannanivorans]|uniref:NUDIX domain-containing protein n=1 Tax=Natronoglomus mannanivorans TaxID=2979990 RepID=A0AAP2YYX7_9EURY|nr:NUDIX domain-containing protein [Halobacteria archaeon AArc-xg1-1]